MTLIDPRQIEIEILTEADRVAFAGGTSYQYQRANPSGAEDRQRDEALLGLLFEGAIVSGSSYRATAGGGTPIPDPRPPNPSYPIDAAATAAIQEFITEHRDILNLRITQRGRLRLYRLRDEILSRDRVRDEFGVLWAHRHWLPDLAVRLRFRDPQEPLSVLLLDVDRLKLLNIELGNPGADKVLRGVFEELRDVVRPNEAYRLGGDEAGAILPGVSLEAASKIAEDLRRAVEMRPWPDLAIQTRPTVSVGVGTVTDALDAENLYVAVDLIRGRAKAHRNRVVAGPVPEAA